MLFLTILLTLLLTFLSTSFISANATQQAPSIHGVFHNNCPFPVWVRQAIAEHPSSRPGELCKNGNKETEEVKVAAGTTFITPVPVIKDSCGHSIKVAREPKVRDVYQYEFTWALENGFMWYNLSHEDGNAFVDVARQIGGPKGSTCPFNRCQAGENGKVTQCDYPRQTQCADIGDVIAFLC